MFKLLMDLFPKKAPLSIKTYPEAAIISRMKKSGDISEFEEFLRLNGEDLFSKINANFLISRGGLMVVERDFCGTYISLRPASKGSLDTRPGDYNLDEESGHKLFDAIRARVAREGWF